MVKINRKSLAQCLTFQLLARRIECSTCLILTVVAVFDGIQASVTCWALTKMSQPMLNSLDSHPLSSGFSAARSGLKKVLDLSMVDFALGGRWGDRAQGAAVRNFGASAGLGLVVIDLPIERAHVRQQSRDVCAGRETCDRSTSALGRTRGNPKAFSKLSRHCSARAFASLNVAPIETHPSDGLQPLYGNVRSYCQHRFISYYIDLTIEPREI